MRRVPSSELGCPNGDFRLHHGFGGPYTGIAYSLFRTGELRSEAEYRHGVPDGSKREYRRDGTVAAEGTLSAGYKEGYWRTWHPNGRLASEEWCHVGVELIRRRWDPAGNLVEDFVRPEADPLYQNMLEFRRTWRMTGPIPRPPGDASTAPAEPGAAPDPAGL